MSVRTGFDGRSRPGRHRRIARRRSFQTLEWNMKPNRTLGLLATLAASLLSVEAGRAGDKPITVGFGTATTGWIAPSDNGLNTAEMAVEVINAKRRPLGRGARSV